jgi:3-hydroxyanthranilate 3,4-dioxygenase
VLERQRPPGLLDRMRWYCDNIQCRKLVFEEAFYCVDLGTQLVPVIEKFYTNSDLRTCKCCGNINRVPEF